MLMNKWKQSPNYKYVCEQLKSLRQDLTIQHLNETRFAVDVYETHARIAMEVGDLSEFNQCQTQLISVYTKKKELATNFFEFTLYRILYYTITNDSISIHSILKELSPEQRKNPDILYGIEIHRYIISNNYALFFRNYKKAPYSAVFLINQLLPKVRFEALVIINKVYNPTKINVDTLQEMLGFKNKEECIHYVFSMGGIFNKTKTIFITKGTKIYKPERSELNKAKAQDNSHGVTHGTFMYT